MSRVWSGWSLAVALGVALSGCAAEVPEPAQQPSALEMEASEDAIEALGAAASIVAMLRDLPEAEGDAPPETEDEVVRAPRSGTSCITVTWDIADPLRLGLDLDACVLPSGEVLDGGAESWIELGPRYAVGLSLDELTLDDQSLDGEVVLWIERGALGADIDLHYTDDGTDVRLVLADASLAITDAGVVIDGEGMFEQDGDVYRIDADGVLFDSVSCKVPAEGTVVLDAPDALPLTIVFGRDMDGEPEVTIQVGSFPPVPFPVSC